MFNWATHRLVAIVLGVFVLPLACTSRGPIAIGDYPTAWTHAYCANRVWCGSYPDLETCGDVQFDSRAWKNWTNYVAAVQAGTIVFDGQQARACVELVRGRGCALSTWPTREARAEACGAVFTGALSPGQVCRLHGECVDGSCDYNTASCDPATGCCRGICVEYPLDRPVALGGACWDADDCAFGAFCSPSTRDPATMGTCQPRVEESGACASGVDCREGLACVPYSDLGICSRAPATGEPCAYFLSPCDDSRDHCDRTADACTPGKAIGAACASSFECIGYARCVSATCQAMPSAIGASCTGPCLGALRCGTDRTCEAPPANPNCYEP